MELITDIISFMILTPEPHLKQIYMAQIDGQTGESQMAKEVKEVDMQAGRQACMQAGRHVVGQADRSVGGQTGRDRQRLSETGRDMKRHTKTGGLGTGGDRWRLAETGAER
jgi:hypothetical protein